MTEETRTTTNNVEPDLKRGIGTDIAVGVAVGIATGATEVVAQKVADAIHPDKPKPKQPKK
jgi:hypothetical protein